jgi:hypothetical protein
MEYEEDDVDKIPDDECTVTQLRKRLRKMRQKLSDKTDSEKEEEAKAADKDREDLASMHNETKTKSEPYEEEDPEKMLADDDSEDKPEKPKKKED